MSSFHAVLHARIPVLKFDASLQGLVHCDLVVNNAPALVNTALQRLCFRHSDEVLTVLWQAVRLWVNGRGLVGEKERATS